MAKRKNKRYTSPDSTPTDERKTMDRQTAKKNLFRILTVVAVTAAVFAIYRLLVDSPYFYIAFPVYLATATLTILGYVIYNRGFSRKNLTVDMLPDEWSDEKKQEYIEDGERRLRRSRPLLVLIIAFIFTFAIDILELYTLPLITEIFTK